jgi:hypothetical protein
VLTLTRVVYCVIITVFAVDALIVADRAKNVLIHSFKKEKVRSWFSGRVKAPIDPSVCGVTS